MCLFFLFRCITYLRVSSVGDCITVRVFTGDGEVGEESGDGDDPKLLEELVLLPDMLPDPKRLRWLLSLLLFHCSNIFLPL